MKQIMHQLVILLLLLVTSPALSQPIRGALAFGTNIAQIDGDEVYGYKKYGFHVGPAAIIPIGDNFLLQIETLFSQKGAYQKYSSRWNDTTPYYNLRLNYLEVPVLFSFTDRDVMSVGTGISWARLSNMKEIEHGKEVVWPTKRGGYNADDLLWLADLRFRLRNKIHLNVRYSYSLTPVRHRTYTNTAGYSWDRKQYNNLLTFRLVYVFNEKPVTEAGSRKN